MKDWFPLTSYEFYAYLTAGMVVIAAFDRVFFGSMLAHEAHWTVVNGVFWAAIAYLVGHIIAIPSSALLEQVLAKRVLHDPSGIILGLTQPRLRETIAARVFGAREYQPFPPDYSAGIVLKVSEALGIGANPLNPEAAFQCAFPHARSVADSAIRLDGFLNQYGLCRNVSLACVIAAALLGPYAYSTGGRQDWMLAIGAIVLGCGLFFRFVKYYAAYTREVFRAFNKTYAVPSVRTI